MTDETLCDLTAVELRRLLGAADVSAREVLDSHLSRIDRVNPLVNALVTIVPEIAAERALEADEKLARGEPLGLLHGLPVAHKDLFNTSGIRTTLGSPIYFDNVPDKNDLIVERQISEGAVTVGKTNTPEFGAGSQTFNEVFGVTKNPYDLSKTCGGSSGGAAVALSTRMLPLCDGSDLGGSLRNPAAFCNVVGFRPSVGRVPTISSDNLWMPMATSGPMARTVSDVALYLSAISGPHPLVPSSIMEAPDSFLGPLDRDFSGTRVAWSPDSGGLPMDGAIRKALDIVPNILSDLGCDVVEIWPDLSEAREIFQTLRAWVFELGYEPLLKSHRDQLKETVIWNIELGRKLSLKDHVDASRKQARMFMRLQNFMDDFEYLVSPVTQVLPFDHSTEFITEINGVELETYIDWMRSCTDISTTMHPAISVPAAFSDSGLPVGVQIVGRNRADLSVLQLAFSFEQATLVGERAPLF